MKRIFNGGLGSSAAVAPHEVLRKQDGSIPSSPTSQSSKPQFEWTTGRVWAVCLLAIFAVIAIAAMTITLTLSRHPYIIRFEMDDNALKALQNVTGTANEISVRQASEVAICQFQNVTLSNDRVMAVWFVGEKCSLLANDKGYELEGVKVKR